jgi:glyoxylase-like metal-dependent hydrolase (beta-lactamase superfamily II)
MAVAQIDHFFDAQTETFSYVVHAGAGTACAIIDSVLNYDAQSGRTSTQSADELIAHIQSLQLSVQWILETHAHADHMSAAHYLRSTVGGQIAMGRAISTVQAVFKGLFHLGDEFVADGRQFDHLFDDQAHFMIGDLHATALHVEGHTPADMAYQIADAVFVGDTLFMPDVGTARCDFPGGDARALYGSIRRLLQLPEQTRLLLCHDYPPKGREHQYQTTVAAQRASNIHMHDGVTEDEFVAMRQQRDATLAVPRLMLPSIQVNIRAGQLPPTESNGVSYLKIPLNLMSV